MKEYVDKLLEPLNKIIPIYNGKKNESLYSFKRIGIINKN